MEGGGEITSDPGVVEETLFSVSICIRKIIEMLRDQAFNEFIIERDGFRTGGAFIVRWK